MKKTWTDRNVRYAFLRQFHSETNASLISNLLQELYLTLIVQNISYVQTRNKQTRIRTL